MSPTTISGVRHLSKGFPHRNIYLWETFVNGRSRSWYMQQQGIHSSQKGNFLICTQIAMLIFWKNGISETPLVKLLWQTDTYLFFGLFHLNRLAFKDRNNQSKPCQSGRTASKNWTPWTKKQKIGRRKAGNRREKHNTVKQNWRYVWPRKKLKWLPHKFLCWCRPKPSQNKYKYKDIVF